MVLLAAAFAAIFMSLVPINHKLLPRCTGPCQHPAFELHGYGFADENHAMAAPLIKYDDATRHFKAHIAFAPPFAPAVCEVFVLVPDETASDPSYLVAAPIGEHPYKDVHETHLELEGEAPDGHLSVGVDCWHMGHPHDVTYSRMYAGMPQDAR